MELGKLSKLKEEPHHLSGAYIRSLVKQLTSSRTKDPMNPNKDLDCDAFPNQNMAKFGEGFSETQQHTQQPHQPQQHKKTSEAEASHQQALPREASKYG
ncbi:hypothetical protein GBA52_028309 [Prunus armeniaca]|nr:hypothetical protein GBA52_028309 [Prunus armeniaca]